MVMNIFSVLSDLATYVVCKELALEVYYCKQNLNLVLVFPLLRNVCNHRVELNG